jgi:hypothetical protein
MRLHLISCTAIETTSAAKWTARQQHVKPENRAALSSLGSGRNTASNGSYCSEFASRTLPAPQFAIAGRAQ